MNKKYLFTLLLSVCLMSCQSTEKSDWVQLFDGKSLNGWVAKFAGHPLGENYKNTFKVQDGLLTIDYSQYEKFNDEFGHLFYQTPYSHYLLRVEYRFLDGQLTLPKNMAWAYRNNGLMLHSQPPETMELAQKFPVSIEVQLLGGSNNGERSTLNLCTPNTDVVIDNKLFTPHCLLSKSKTYRNDQWVTVEIEVRGDEVIRHKIDGEVVLEYQQPQLDAKSFEKYKDIYGGKLLTSGYIAIQAETHPTQFKRIELKVLK